MTQAIIFTNENGGVSVCIPTGELPIKQVQEKDTPSGSRIVDVSDLPNEYNDFFEAWEIKNGKVEVNLEKAKELTRNRLRAERVLPMSAQDVAFQRALEEGEDTTLIVEEKKRLRDITKLADKETTLEGLRALKV